MDGDNLCRVMNSLSIIASEKIREELSLGMREIIPFLSVILLWKNWTRNKKDYKFCIFFEIYNISKKRRITSLF